MPKTWRTVAKRKYIPRNPVVTSAMMATVKNRNSKAELLLRRTLFARGWRYRLHSKHLIGKPDLVFRKRRIVVFVDGDFWHGRALVEEGIEGLKRGLRTERSDWWVAKIQRTVERDRTVTRSLNNDGWTVIRFWESEIVENVESVVLKLESKLNDSASRAAQ